MNPLLFSFFLFQLGLTDCLPAAGSWITCGTSCRGDCPISCEVVGNVQTGASSYWDDWDFVLSNVAQGPTTISINTASTIPTIFTVEPQDPPCYGLGAYTSAISSALGVSVTESWNVFDNGSQYSVPAGHYGVLVINPWTKRTDGSAKIGVGPCEGSCSYSPTNRVPWEVDTRQQDPSLGPGIYVGGQISLLTSPSLPIPCKIGSCSHS